MMAGNVLAIFPSALVAGGVACSITMTQRAFLARSLRVLAVSLVTMLGQRATAEGPPAPASGTADARPDGATRAASATPSVSIPHTKHILSNGLTVILHEDHAVPLAVVNLSYNVGSRDEKPGRTGFAHLFEHLMFMGTRRAPTKMFDAWMEAAGGWNNAWTSEDRTDYFNVGPSTALPLLLWLEADRLRDIGPLMTQEKLDAQRDVVKNERRQSYENRPYGKADLRLTELLHVEGHPYHHPVIGSHKDLEAASVRDVQEFFAQYYDPANASLVVAGDFRSAEVLADIKRLFEGIASRGKPMRAASNAAQSVLPVLPSPVLETVTDDVELARVTLAWPSPAHFGPGDAELDLAAAVLGDGKSSRLYRRLVFEQKLAQSVSAHQASAALSSHFEVEVLAKPGVALPVIEAAIADEVAKLGRDGPTMAELERVRAGYEAGFIKRLESVRERASLLNLYQAERGRPDAAESDLQRYRDASIASVKRAVSNLVATPRVTLRVVPSAKERKAGAR
jgi:predicted Zn-dependent peptidase